ncbi:hypothetical protein [Methylotuvimicrobium buryatense]|uniref:Uncharacterized protein n=1 Tax=Methylotuvimicrobium buryatense TaxID=95641 RepID=A0A4P9USA5_METBY|nr:hypothetical protein [Methylotuvimicrobium buryatense]QCW84412.1 hypothetical protein EQU24_20870 [Methylotuvimicrobium buryatense]
MALRRVAMPCILPPPALFAQTPAKHPALRLSGTKNLHFANAPFPRFSANDVRSIRRGQYLGWLVAALSITGAVVTAYWGAHWAVSCALVGVPILGTVKAIIGK